MGTYHENMTFEADVRRVAEAIWNLAPGGCQPRHYSGNPAITELDGMARLRDISHLLMVTTSTKLDKVKEDVHKLQAAEKVEKRERPGLSVALWLVTEQALNAEHIKYASDRNVKTVPLVDFKRRCFDGHKYISRRHLN